MSKNGFTNRSVGAFARYTQYDKLKTTTLETWSLKCAMHTVKLVVSTGSNMPVSVVIVRVTMQS